MGQTRKAGEDRLRFQLRTPPHIRALAAEFAKFGVVGAVCTVVDVGLFNVLHLTAGLEPLGSKTVSTVVAVTVSYAGNRHWSFRHRARLGVTREYSVFFLLNGVGLAIALVCLALTTYVLGLTGPLAVNVAGNVVGMGAATAFRFWSYRRWVFPPAAASAPSYPAALKLPIMAKRAL